MFKEAHINLPGKRDMLHAETTLTSGRCRQFYFYYSVVMDALITYHTRV